MKASYKIMLILSVCILIGCGTAKRTLRPSSQVAEHSSGDPIHHSHHTPRHNDAAHATDDSPSNTTAASHSSPPPAFAVSKYAEVKVSLQQAYRDWKGTNYVWGGETHAGIDCSGLIQIIFKRYFGVKLPRNTKRQLYRGKFVHRSDLKSGDLVFFHTGHKELHVGIIIKGDRFLHASVSQGVTISSLKGRYWKRHYMTARRVLEF
jgi:lipoprotein Spr